MGYVYFLRSGDNVKIGFTERPRERFREHATSNPSTRLVGIMWGSREDERNLHKRFAAYRVRGEWFRVSTEIEGHLNNRFAVMMDLTKFLSTHTKWDDGTELSAQLVINAYKDYLRVLNKVPPCAHLIAEAVALIWEVNGIDYFERGRRYYVRDISLVA